MIAYMAQPLHPLTNQVFAMFFHSASMPAPPRYLEFTDKYSPQYRKSSFSLYFPSRHEISLRHIFRSFLGLQLAGCKSDVFIAFDLKASVAKLKIDIKNTLFFDNNCDENFSNLPAWLEKKRIANQMPLTLIKVAFVEVRFEVVVEGGGGCIKSSPPTQIRVKTSN